MLIEPVTLRGDVVTLEPLAREHADEFGDGALDPDIWRFTLSHVATADDLHAYVAGALSLQAAGVALPFLIRHNATGRAAGSTRYGNIDMRHRRVEIGWTWLMRPWQRTAVNTEAKLLLLRHAFDVLGCNRVEFRTDALNVRSRAALARIGAVEEGILRRHMITDTGRVRDTVCFGITDRDWSRVRDGLEARLRGAAPAVEAAP